MRIKSHGAHLERALLTERDAPVRIRGSIGDELRRVPKASGVAFAKRVGGLMRGAEEIFVGELAVAPELRSIPGAARRTRSCLRLAP